MLHGTQFSMRILRRQLGIQEAELHLLAGAEGSHAGRGVAARGGPRLGMGLAVDEAASRRGTRQLPTAAAAWAPLAPTAEGAAAW